MRKQAKEILGKKWATSTTGQGALGLLRKGDAREQSQGRKMETLLSLVPAREWGSKEMERKVGSGAGGVGVRGVRESALGVR